jgi:hypothetical protein
LSDVISVQVPKPEPVVKSRSVAVSGGTAVQLAGVAPLQGRHSVGTPLLASVVPVAPPEVAKSPVLLMPPVVARPPVVAMPPVVATPPVLLIPPVVAMPPVAPVVPAPPEAPAFIPEDEQAADIAATTIRPRPLLPANETQELVMPQNLQKWGLPRINLG